MFLEWLQRNPVRIVEPKRAMVTDHLSLGLLCLFYVNVHRSSSIIDFIIFCSLASHCSLRDSRCRRSIDERCFILKVMDKIVAALLISFVGLCLMPTVTMRKVSKIWIIGSNLGFSHGSSRFIVCGGYVTDTSLGYTGYTKPTTYSST